MEVLLERNDEKQETLLEDHYIITRAVRRGLFGALAHTHTRARTDNNNCVF